jgi:hypothetical protein
LRPAEACEFAHVYLDGALEARRRAEAQGLLPPVSSGTKGEDARVGYFDSQPPPLLPSPSPSATYSYHGYGTHPQPTAAPPSASASALAAQGQSQRQPALAGPDSAGIVYESRPTKIYVQMPRTRTGQRVCYYHNAGRCTNPACPFLHVLVRV